MGGGPSPLPPFGSTHAGTILPKIKRNYFRNKAQLFEKQASA